MDMGSILIYSISFVHNWAHALPLVYSVDEKYVSVNIVVFNLRYQICRSLLQKRRRKQGCSTALTPRCVVTLVLCFAVVNTISHLSANASGETPFCIVDEIEMKFTYSSHNDVNASILKLGLGVGVIVGVQSFMNSGCAVGVFVFGLRGRGALTLRTSRLGLLLVLVSPLQLVIVLSCWSYMDKLGSQSGVSEVNTRLVYSFTSDIPFGLLVEIYEVVPWRARVNQVFSVGKKIE